MSFADTFEVHASQNHVRQCILSHDKILQYYPFGNMSADLEAGRFFYCGGKVGISLFEILINSEHHIRQKIYSTEILGAKLTVEDLKRSAFFTMIEDWKIEAEEHKDCCRLTREFSEIEQFRLKLLPMKWMVPVTAKLLERKAIQKYWQED